MPSIPNDSMDISYDNESDMVSLSFNVVNNEPDIFDVDINISAESGDESIYKNESTIRSRTLTSTTVEDGFPLSVGVGDSIDLVVCADVVSQSRIIPSDYAARWKAESLTTTLSDGDLVDKWPSLTGSNDLRLSDVRNAGQITLQKNGLNGKATVKYGHWSNWHDTGFNDNGIIGGSTPRTVIVVLASARGGDTAALAGQAGRLPADNDWFVMLHDSNNDLRMNTFGTGFNAGLASPPPYAVIGMYDGLNVKTFKNGVEGNSLELGLSTNNNPFMVSSRDHHKKAPDLPLFGEISEIIVYDRELLTSELDRLWRYVDHEYGIGKGL